MPSTSTRKKLYTESVFYLNPFPLFKAFSYLLFSDDEPIGAGRPVFYGMECECSLASDALYSRPVAFRRTLVFFWMVLVVKIPKWRIKAR